MNGRNALIPAGLLGMLFSAAAGLGAQQPSASLPAPPSGAAAASSAPAIATTTPSGQSPSPAQPVSSPAQPISSPAQAASSPASTELQPVPVKAIEPPVPEVVVEADEPRFVARTTRDRIGRIWAPVVIDGKGPFRLVLDTGANHSAIIPSTAAALGSPGAAEVIVVTGFTGSAVVPTISVSSMEVGELLMGPTRLPVVPDVFGGAQGVLGNEGLQGKRILADFSHDRLVIEHSRGEAANIGFSVVNFKLIQGGLPLVDVKIGGLRCKAIIDTGAQGSVGNIPLRDALMHHAQRNAKHAEIVGVTLDVQNGDSLPAPQIELGGITINGVHVIFGDMYLFEHWKMNDKPVLLIGMDLLGSFDVLIIDYRMQQLQVRLTRASLPP